jgi:AmmeMemoRadiSam system protein A
MSHEKSQSTQAHLQALPILNEQQRQELLRLARQAITEKVTNRSSVPTGKDNQPFDENAAVFVTLWQRGSSNSPFEDDKRLRGCIGRLQPDLPLDTAVKYAAVSAATRDPRFVAVQPYEVDSLMIEIAILSPLEEINSLDEVVIGRDGLVIEAMGRRGLLLPKVATRLNWDKKEFLRNVCLKAGLPEDIWPGDGKLYKFSTEVFHD